MARAAMLRRRSFVLPRRASRERGATLVEFVIVSPLAFLLVLALIQTGMLMMAKLTLNNATFMAARYGATANGTESAVRSALKKELIPFYQDSTETNAIVRITKAGLKVETDPMLLATLKVDRLNPPPEAFSDFGIDSPDGTYIPNDNLQWRSLTPGTRSKLNIRDANLLKIKVTYGYQLKVPLMAFVMQRVMCGGSGGPQAFGGDVSLFSALGSPSDCLLYYTHGMVPLVSYAIVEMQSPARLK